MSKHTPGPWEWDGPVWNYNPDEEAPWLIDNKGNRVLSGGILCNGEANARLIAQAPRLLEALEELERYADGFSVSGVYLNEEMEGKRLLDKARAAIEATKGNDNG